MEDLKNIMVLAHFKGRKKILVKHDLILVEFLTFELLDGNKKRVRIIHKNPNMSDYVKTKLKFYLENFDPTIEE